MQRIRTISVALITIIPLILSGCTTTRVAPIEKDWGNQIYSGKSKQEIIQAAKEAIRLIDPKKVKITDTPDGFNAEREKISYYVIETGHDLFKFKFIAKESNNTIQTQLDIEETIFRASLKTLGVPVTSTGSPANRYVYDLFYSRVDYLLGKNEKWFSCKDTINRLPAGLMEVESLENIGLSSFCGRFVEDVAPSSILATGNIFK